LQSLIDASGRGRERRPRPRRASLVRVATVSALAGILAGDSFAGTASVEVELRAAMVPAGAWVEVTPLQTSARRQVALWPKAQQTLRLSVTPAASIICFGGNEVATACTQVMISGAGQGLPVSYRKGRPIVGRCRVGGAPMAGATVALFPASLHANRSFTVPLKRAPGAQELERHVVTDAAGRFEIPPIAPGWYQLELLLPGGRIHHPEPFVVEMPSDPRRAAPTVVALDLGDLVVPAGLSMAVRVVDHEGMPLKGALVTASQGAALTESQYCQTQSASDGWATFPGLGAGGVALACAAKGHVPFGQTFESVPLAAECRLDAVAGIHGTLVDEDGSSVPGGSVFVAGAGSNAVTATDGSFDLRGLAPGLHTLQASASGYAVQTLNFSLAPGEALALGEIVLHRGEEIEGRVIDAVDRHPIPGASVTVLDPPGAGSAVTDDEGRYRLVTGGVTSLRVAAAAAGYAPQRLSLAASDGKLTPIGLSKGGRVRAVVWDEDTEGPCASCGVIIQGVGIEPLALTTGADGTAMTDVLPPGNYVVGLEQVRSVGSVVQMQGGDTAKIARVVDGTVTEVRFGQRFARIVVSFDIPLPGDWVLTARSSSASGTGRQQPDGGFGVRKPEGEAVSLNLGDGKGTEVHVGVLSASESRTTVAIALPKTRVIGALTQAEGPIANAAIQLVSPPFGPRAWALSDSTGGFAVPFVPPGAYSLVVRGKPIRPVVVTPDLLTDLGTIGPL
jgi:hypothetical protein